MSFRTDLITAKKQWLGSCSGTWIREILQVLRFSANKDTKHLRHYVCCKSRAVSSSQARLSLVGG